MDGSSKIVSVVPNRSIRPSKLSGIGMTKIPSFSRFSRNFARFNSPKSSIFRAFVSQNSKSENCVRMPNFSKILTSCVRRRSLEMSYAIKNLCLIFSKQKVQNPVRRRSRSGRIFANLARSQRSKFGRFRIFRTAKIAPISEKISRIRRAKV